LKYIEFSKDEVKIFNQNIAENIKKIRKLRNISQLELALSIGHSSVSTIAKIEARLENKHFNLEHLYKISKVLEVDICEFFK